MFCKICSDFLKPTTKITSFHTFYRLYQTHYEVLNLSPNCTAKQIKNAFIQLSKEHHPDVNKCKHAKAKFQEINEAYKVLCKPDSRRDYDLGLACLDQHPRIKRPYTQTYYYEQAGRNPYDDPLFWANRDKRQDEYYRNVPYYGIDGLPRLSNGAILMFCVFFSLIGVGLQFLAINKSVTFERQTLIKKSAEAEKVLHDTREGASTNGNAAQLEALKNKLLGNVLKETENK